MLKVIDFLYESKYNDENVIPSIFVRIKQSLIYKESLVWQMYCCK